MTAHDFVTKWQRTNLKERAAAQEHFIDLCNLLREKTPADADPTGDRYTFERKVTKTTGGKGFADVGNQLLSSDNKLTMTKLYNELEELQEKRDTTHRTYSLLLAHERLDEAVAAAYGWEWPLEDEEVLSRLLALNLKRAAGQTGTDTVDAAEDKDAVAADWVCSVD